jgi:hypothetical protein
VEIKPVQLDQFSAKALTDALKRMPVGPETLADVIGRRNAAFAEDMFREWGSSLGSESATESFVYDCMVAAGFKFDLITSRYYHPDGKVPKRRRRK